MALDLQIVDVEQKILKTKNSASRVDFSDVRGAAGAIIEHCRSAGGTTATAAKRVRLGAVHMATRPSNLERLVARESWEAELSVRPAAQAWCMKKLGRKTASCTHTHISLLCCSTVAAAPFSRLWCPPKQATPIFSGAGGCPKRAGGGLTSKKRN